MSTETLTYHVPKTVNLRVLLDAVEKQTGQEGRIGVRGKTHCSLLFFASDFPTPESQEELAGFISGFVAAWQYLQADRLPKASKACPNPLGEPADWDEPLMLSDDDSPQMMPGPDQFR